MWTSIEWWPKGRLMQEVYFLIKRPRRVKHKLKWKRKKRLVYQRYFCLFDLLGNLPVVYRYFQRIIMSILEEKVDIRGGYQKPVWTDLFMVQIFIWPYRIYKWFEFHIRWYVKFTLKNEEYGEEEKLILIKKNLRSQWESNSHW